MSYTMQYVFQGQQQETTVSLAGDPVSIPVTVAPEATEVTNVGVVPDSITQIMITTTVDITVDCGTNSPSTIAGGELLAWSTGCGLAAPFAGASLASFTVVSTDAVDTGTVKILVKTANS